MEKVKISKLLADAIEYYKKDHGDFWRHHLLADAVESERYIGKIKHANEIKTFTENGGLEVLLQAIVNDYKVEETPEDKVKSYYEVCSERIATTQDPSEYKTFSGERDGIRNTLILLNIKIEGIN